MPRQIHAALLSFSVFSSFADLFGNRNNETNENKWHAWCIL